MNHAFYYKGHRVALRREYGSWQFSIRTVPSILDAELVNYSSALQAKIAAIHFIEHELPEEFRQES
jgi:hypothetical protein